MPRLPDVSDLGARPVPQSRRGVVSVRNAGAWGEAFSDFGQTVAGIGEDLKQRDDAFQMATARSAFLARKIALDSEFAEDQALDTKEKRYTEELAKARTEAQTMIRSSRARGAFSIDTEPDVARAVAGIRSSVVQGRRDVSRAQLTEALRLNNNAALAAKDETDAERITMTSVAAVDAAREAGYISAQEAADQRQAVVQKFAEDRVSLMSAEQQMARLQPTLGKDASGWLGWIPIERRQTIYEQARVALRTEQRAARTEARAAMQSLVDDAEEVARLASDGIPVPMPAFETAIRNASAAGKDALVYRLRVGKVQAALSAEFRTATPTDLQNEVNALDARIANAGTKASPEDVIARHHLSSLRDKATQALATDPLSWAASARGVAIPPLDWNDPRTLGARLKVARTVSKETGAPLSPLTDEEATTLKNQMDRGPAGQLEVLDNIRRFGSAGAPAAARQLAPTNDGFRAAAALATMPNGMAIAKDAIIGSDALKAQPDIFDTDDAQREYGKLAVSMRLLPPEMRRGVFDAARNIYAAEQTRGGNRKWDAGLWPEAVSAALGAYKDARGTMRGGLGRWKREAIVLPPSWSQKEFEDAVSQADAATIARAGGGRPVWSNGSAVTPEQLKRLRLVNEGPGIYRLYDGNGYIAREDGQPFRLNVTKLR